MPVHVSLACQTVNWIGESNLQSNNPGERKKCQLDGFPAVSVSETCFVVAAGDWFRV